MKSESYYLEKGLELKQAGLYEKALTCYQELLTVFPVHCEALYQISEIYYLQGKEEESLALCHQIIQQYPQFYWSYKTLGNLLLKQEKLEAAYRAYSQALELNPNFVEALVNLGTTLYKLGHLKAAIELYEKAIQLEPNFAVTYWNLGNIFQQEGFLARGITYAQKALQLDPKMGVIHPDILAGYQSDQNKNFPQAIDHYQKAINENPSALLAYMGLGLVYRHLGKFDKAIENYKIAIQVKSSCAEAHYQLGLTLLEIGRTHQKILVSQWYRGIQSLITTLELNSSYSLAHKHIFEALINQGMTYINELQPLLEKYEEICEKTGNILGKVIIIVNSLKAGHYTIAQEKFLGIEQQLVNATSLSLIEREALYLYLLPAIPYLRDHIHENGRLFQLISHRYQEICIIHPKIEDSTFPPQASIPLKIGFIGQDIQSFARESSGYDIIAELAQMTPYLYFYITRNIKPDSIPPQLRKVAKKIYLAGENYQQSLPVIIQQIINNHIDILIDVEGTKNPCNVQILAAKPAPVCLSWLVDLPPFIKADNYFMGDIHCYPQTTDKYYLEKWLPLSPVKAIKQVPISPGDKITLRSSVGITAEQLVYLSLGDVKQFNPELIQAQISILKQVPHSVLFCQVLDGNSEILSRIYREECQKQDINPHRIKWGDTTPTAEQERLIYMMGDIFLDTYPYNHHIHSLEALWFDLPLVTRWGEQPMSRVGYSYLKHLQIETGMSQSWEEYIHWGIRLGSESNLREEIKTKLRQSKNPETLSPLWNPTQVAQNLYRIFKQKLARQQRLIVSDHNLLI